MASRSKQRNSKPQRQRGGRTDFRAEFYHDPDAAERRRAARARAADTGKGRRQRVPLFVMVGCSAILFCIIAVGGSSAMIWLRNLGALFDVYWTGDF